MARSLGTLTLDLIARTGSYITGLNKSERETERWKRKVRRQFKQAQTAVSNFSKLAAGALIGLTALTIRNTEKQQQAVRQLEQGLASTGNVVGKSLKELTDQAAALQRASTFGDEAIIAAQSQLITFTNITEDRFDRTIQSVLDLSARMDQDLKTSVLALGKALNDPVANLGALSRSGIQFSEEQKKVIKALVETNRLADAQGVILDELERQFGGSAKAATETLGGAVKQLGNAFGDLFEQNETSQEVIDDLHELTDLLQDPKTVEAANTLTSALITVFGAVAKAITDAVNVTEFLAESLAAKNFGPAAGDIVRITERIGQLQGEIAQLNLAVDNTSAPAEEAFFLKRIRESQKELDNLIRLRDDYNKQPPASTDVLQPVTVTAKRIIDTTNLPDPAEVKKQTAAYENLEQKLQQQVATFNEASKSADILYRIQEGNLKNLNDAQKTRLTDLVQELDLLKEQEQRKDSAQFVEAVNNEVDARRRALDLETEGIGIGERRRALAQEIAEIEERYADQIRELSNEQGRNNALSQEAYQERLEALRAAQIEEVQVVRDAAEKKREAEMDWINGARRSIEDYVDSAADLSGQIEGVLTGAFSSAEDALVKFAQTGKLNFTDFANSVIADLIRIGARKAIVEAIGAVAGFSGGGGGSGGFAGFFATGGSIGPGQFGIAGETRPEIVVGPATVLNPEKTDRLLATAQPANQGPTNVIFNMPGITNAREAKNAQGYIRRAYASAAASGNRYT